ncbi:unnamed protein product [Schistocephalus solidus]|uniref:Aa_trans domain-containing protein n=1 Tax=Schistocephalus solidus TaxID=70667 RepID=A0A183TB03_SCHSO|nr:unnamed protein product [Schistocephalus solidus]
MIFAARQLKEKCQEMRTHLNATFVDQTKAFGTVNRDGLWKIMQKFGCPERFTHMVGILSPIAYAISNSVTIGLFALVILEMRTKAPGANTFPQVVKCRFGTTVHIIVVIAFLLTPVFSVMQIVNNAFSILDAATEESNSEKIIICIYMSIAACVAFAEFGNFPQILYVTSIFLIGTTAILGISIFNDSQNFPLGTEDRLYKLLDCYKPPDVEQPTSFLSVYNRDGLWAVLVNFVGT